MEYLSKFNEKIQAPFITFFSFRHGQPWIWMENRRVKVRTSSLSEAIQQRTFFLKRRIRITIFLYTSENDDNDGDDDTKGKDILRLLSTITVHELLAIRRVKMKVHLTSENMKDDVQV